MFTAGEDYVEMSRMADDVAHSFAENEDGSFFDNRVHKSVVESDYSDSEEEAAEESPVGFLRGCWVSDEIEQSL